MDLNELEALTIGHYDSNAQSFWEGTCDHDVSQNIDALLSACPENGCLDILDFGCGPGRDLQTLKALGHRPVGLDGSAAFCRMARAHSGCEVLHQQFLKTRLEANRFDAVFANASLFHIPSQEFPRVLLELHQTLRTGGILFSSNPRGDSEGFYGDRYGHYMELDTIKAYLADAGFDILHYYYRPTGLPCDQQPWLAVVSKALAR